jgi:hypothetical protein
MLGYERDTTLDQANFVLPPVEPEVFQNSLGLTGGRRFWKISH